MVPAAPKRTMPTKLRSLHPYTVYFLADVRLASAAICVSVWLFYYSQGTGLPLQSDLSLPCDHEFGHGDDELTREQ